MWPVLIGAVATFAIGVWFERNRSAVMGGTPSSAPLQTSNPIVQVALNGPAAIVPIGATVIVTPPPGFVVDPPTVGPTSSDTTVLEPQLIPGTTTPIPNQFYAQQAGKATVGGNLRPMTNLTSGPITQGSVDITVQ